MIATALEYATRGLAVFPVRIDKTPLPRRGHLEATTDRGQITAWWQRWPAAGIGIACRPSGLLVVDIDPRHGGDDSLHALERQHGALPDTWTSQTGGGGEHRFFVRPPGPLADRPIAPGVDIKTNGYVIAPPSRHASGRRYEWVIGFTPDDLPPAAVPPWLMALVTATGASQLRRDGTPLVIPDGTRNATLLRLGGLLRRYGLNPAALLGCLRAINREHCRPPVGEEELQRIAASLARYAPTTSVTSTAGRAGG